MSLGNLAQLLSGADKSAGKATQKAARAVAAKRAIASPSKAAPSLPGISLKAPPKAYFAPSKPLIESKQTEAQQARQAHHSLFSLHTLEDAAGVIGKGAQELGAAVMPGSLSRQEATANVDRQLAQATKAQLEGKTATLPGAHTRIGGSLGVMEAAAAPPQPGHVLKSLATAAKNTPGSAERTVVNTIPGLVATGGAVVKAVEGHPQQLEQIAKGIGGMLTHPVATFEKEPVPMALMLAGGEGATGRLAGAAMRSGALGDRAAEIASMDRAPLHIYGTSTGGSADQIDAGLHDVAIPRKYSPDVIRKGAQVAVEKFRARTHDPNIATPEQANRYLYGGSLIGAHMMKKMPFAGVRNVLEKTQGTFGPGLVDEQAAKGEMIRRMYAHEAADMMRKIKPKHGAEAVPLAVEGILRRPETVKADLEKELARLKGEANALKRGGPDTQAAMLTGKELKLNKANQKQIETLLADHKFLANPHPAFEAARQYAATSAPLEERLVQLGHLEPDQLNAKLVPYALSHMGPDVRYNEQPGAHPLVAQVKSAERQVKAAKKTEERALRARDEANTLHPRVPAGHPVATAREALRRAERAHAYAEGRSTDLHAPGGGASPRMLNPAAVRGDLPKAQDAYRAAKADLMRQRQAAVAQARERLMDARDARDLLARDLLGMKAAGFIKHSGEMWPRLERAGVPLPSDAIKAHMQAELGDRGIGFLTHKQDQTWGKALESYAGKRPGGETRSRTGVSFRHGTYDRSYGALGLQAYRTANAIAGHESRDEMLRRFGLGRFHTLQDAERAADNFAHTKEGTQIETRVGKLTPQLIGSDRVVAQRNVETRMLGPILRDFGLAEHKAVNEALDAPKYTLLPETVAQRILEHDKLNQSTNLKKLGQIATNKWRSTNLFTSPRWLLGNPQEHAIRLAMANVNPAAIFGAGRAVKLGKDIIDHWHSIMADPSRTEAERYMAKSQVGAYQGGTHYGSIAINTVHRGAEDTADAREFARSLDETGPISKVIAGWEKWKGLVKRGMGAIERNSKAAALGKAALNETHKFTDDWQALIKRQDTAVKKFAEGKLSPNEASKLGNDIMEMMGNWSTLTPAVRSMVQTVSPFGLWWLTSMKFVFRALPRDHPMKTAALAAMAAATRNPQVEAETPAYLAGGIKMSLPIVGDVTTTPTYYSPFGTMIDPLHTAADEILPQVTDPLMTMRGVNPVTDQPLETAQKKPLDAGHLAAQAAYSLLEGYVPGVRQAASLIKEGGRPEPGSFNPLAIQPGTQRGLGQELVKLFSPVRYIAGPRGSSSGAAKLPPGVRERPTRERALRERPVRERAVRERPIRER